MPPDVARFDFTQTTRIYNLLINTNLFLPVLEPFYVLQTLHNNTNIFTFIYAGKLSYEIVSRQK